MQKFCLAFNKILSLNNYKTLTLIRQHDEKNVVKFWVRTENFKNTQEFYVKNSETDILHVKNIKGDIVALGNVV